MEATLEQVAGAVVPLVEPLRVDAVQPVHEPGHRVAGAFEDGVEVVRHQAERRARELVLERQAPQREHERQAIVVVEVDQAAVDAASGGVEDGRTAKARIAAGER